VACLIALHHTPDDPQQYDGYYFATHVPLALKLPGLRRFEVTRGPVVQLGGRSDVHLVAILYFDDVAAIHAAIESPEGKVASADIANFAKPEGVEILISESEQLTRSR